MKKLTGLLALVCIAISANAQIMWKISGNGLEKPSYLFGTHHLAPRHFLDSIKGWEPAFNETTQVVGELIMSEAQSPAGMQLMQQHMMLDGEKNTKDLFSPEEYAMVRKLVIENLKFDIEQMPKLKPAFISNHIVLALYMKHISGYNPQEQPDTYFQLKAEEKKMALHALESLAFQIDLIFNSSPVERQAELLVCALSDIDKTIEKTIRLNEAYMRQDLDAILAIAMEKEGTACDFLPSEMAAMNDDRNVEWMKKIPAFIQDQPTFIAVGALHLTGEKGLLHLLKEAGYTLEAVR